MVVAVAIVRSRFFGFTADSSTAVGVALSPIPIVRLAAAAWSAVFTEHTA